MHSLQNTLEFTGCANMAAQDLNVHIPVWMYIPVYML